MRVRIVLLSIAGLALAACGSSRNDEAAGACKAEIAKQLAGKTYELDLHDLAAHAKAESTDTVVLSSTAVFDKGLSTEYKQTYDCRVRFDAAGKPSVLFLEFNWNLKKAD
ncbi:MAG TPA: hypothetical protein VFB32_08230 [Rudaea sp.]|nr:hypothetical protein [Rudaea sp.]